MVVGGWWPRAAAAVYALSGWRRYGLAFVLGALAAAALPPVHAVPVLLVSFTGFIWLLRSSRSRKATFFAGWWFGWGHFVAGLYWIAHALLTDPARYGWMIPFAVGGLSAILAVYPALAGLATRAKRFSGVGQVLIFAVAWTIAEWARGVLFTGFPWSPIGSVWTGVPHVLQGAALFGVYGLTLLTVSVAAMPAILGNGKPRGWRPVAVMAAVLAIVWIGGAVRLQVSPMRVVDGVTLRLVQPNIDQARKWRRELMRDHIDKLVRLSTTGPKTVTAVIWPETAVPFYVANNPGRRALITAAVPKDGLLITGAMRYVRAPKFRVWNSVHAIDGAGTILATYDKFHLVPFGEYVPFRSVLDIGKMTVGTVDFSSGKGPRTVAVSGLPPFSPLICYEVIFPASVTEPGRRPGWLLNVTNDGWFGISSGPYQHLASARMRAVEEGLPLVRAANSGISVVYDPLGRELVRLPLGKEGVADAPLPAALSAPTPFALFGNLMLAGLVMAVCAAAIHFRNL